MEDLKNEIKMRFLEIEDDIKLIKTLEDSNFFSKEMKGIDDGKKIFYKNIRKIFSSSLIPHIKWWIIIFLYWILEYSICMSIQIIFRIIKEKDINLLSMDMKTKIVYRFSKNTNKYWLDSLKHIIETWIEDDAFSNYGNFNKWIIENWWEKLNISEKINSKDKNWNLHSIKWNIWKDEIKLISEFFWWTMNLTTQECEVINQIKWIRNQLCHWEKTFSSVWWSFAIQDVIKIKNLMHSAINKYLKKVDTFLLNEDYLKK